MHSSKIATTNNFYFHYYYGLLISVIINPPHRAKCKRRLVLLNSVVMANICIPEGVQSSWRNKDFVTHSSGRRELLQDKQILVQLETFSSAASILSCDG